MGDSTFFRHFMKSKTYVFFFKDCNLFQHTWPKRSHFFGKLFAHSCIFEKRARESQIWTRREWHFIPQNASKEHDGFDKSCENRNFFNMRVCKKHAKFCVGEIPTVETRSKRCPDVVHKKTPCKNVVQRFFKMN